MSITKEYLKTLLTSCLNTLSDMDEDIFYRGLNGFTLAVNPFPDEDVPPTWVDAMLRYEREFPPEGKNFYNTFELEQREVYQEVYALLIDNLDIIQANTEYFTAFLDQYAEPMG